MTNPDPHPIHPSQLRPGPIRHESFSEEVLAQIRSIYEIIGPYLETTLEQFEIGFMRDMHPDGEVFLWSCITAAWMDFHKQHLNDELLPDIQEKKLIAALIAISTGIEDAEKLGLPVDVGQKLLACYDALGDERGTRF